MHKCCETWWLHSQVAYVTSFQQLPSFEILWMNGEGKRQNEFAEWHVICLAEWHNYAECNIWRMTYWNKLNWKLRPFLAAVNSQAASFWCCGLDYDGNQKARKDSLISHGRLAFLHRLYYSGCWQHRYYITKVGHWRKVVLKGRDWYQGQNIFTINVTFLPILDHINETEWKLFLFKTVGRVFDRDITFRDRAYLVFCFLGCVVKF